MGIISETSDSVVKQPKPFPKLVKSGESGNIFLLTSEYIGTCVFSPSGRLKVGEHYNNWIGPFEDYEGTITLSNE